MNKTQDRQMTTRDGVALVAFLAYLIGRNTDLRNSDPKAVARSCYKYADEFLIEGKEEASK